MTCDECGQSTTRPGLCRDCASAEMVEDRIGDWDLDKDDDGGER